MTVDDEMEALDYAIRVPISELRVEHKPLWKLISSIQESVIAAGFRRPGPVTDAQVKAAVEVYHLRKVNSFSHEWMRAALEAAQGVTE